MMKRKNKNTEKRTKTIKVKLKESTFEKIQDLKKLGGFETWEDMIIFLLSEKKSIKKVYIDPTGKSLECINHLKKIGTNINQIAHSGNRNSFLTSEERSRYKKLSNDLIKIKNYFCKNVLVDYNNKGGK